MRTKDLRLTENEAPTGRDVIAKGIALVDTPIQPHQAPTGRNRELEEASKRRAKSDLDKRAREVKLIPLVQVRLHFLSNKRIQSL